MPFAEKIAKDAAERKIVVGREERRGTIILPRQCSVHWLPWLVFLEKLRFRLEPTERRR
ncbi:hypothetical protein ABIC01_008498 [Bradyrhizobium sp. RT4b]